MNAAIFLDRDNTLIDNDGDLGDPAGVKLLLGAASALASLRGLGYRMVVVTNQGGVARGKYTEEDVDKVNQRISEVIRATSGATIDAFYFCPYHPQGTVDKYRREHPWRKPAPGMLLQAAKDLNLDLSLSWMVGDQMRDVEAGLAAGVRTILLTPEAEDFTPLKLEQIAAGDFASVQTVRPHFRARSLIEAVRIIAQQRTPDDVRLRQRTQTDAAKPEALSTGLFAGVVGGMTTEANTTTAGPGGPAISTVLPTPKSSSTRNIPRPVQAMPVKPVATPSPVTPSVSTQRPSPGAVNVPAAVASPVAAAPAAATPAPVAAQPAPEKKPSTSLLGDLDIEDDEPDESDSLKGGMAPVGAAVSEPPAAMKPAAAAPIALAAPVAPIKPAVPVAPPPAAPVQAAAPVVPPAAPPVLPSTPPAPPAVPKAAAPIAPVTPPAPPAPPAPPKAPVTEPATAIVAAAPVAPVAPTKVEAAPIAPASVPVAPAPLPKPPAPVAPIAVAPPAVPAPPGASSEEIAKIDTTLREILREMRNHRGIDQDFSVLAVIATVLQMVTIVCFLGALVIGRGEGGSFDRWMYAAILLQLMTITTLKFRK